MHFEIVDADDVDPELLCPLCQNVWGNPVELAPCGDIFCRDCIKIEHIRQLKQSGDDGNEPFRCPKCQEEVAEEKPPNRVLVNVASEVEVRCSECGWTGTRGTAGRHVCPPGTKRQAKREDTGSPTSTSSPTLTTPATSSVLAASPKRAPEPQPPAEWASPQDHAPFARSSFPSLPEHPVHPNGFGAAGAATPSPRAMRRAQDDVSESALLRNFDEICDESQLARGSGGSGGGSTTQRDHATSGLLPPLRTPPLTGQHGSGLRDSPSSLLGNQQGGSMAGIGGSFQNMFDEFANTTSGSLPPLSGGRGAGSDSRDAPWRELGLPQVEYDQLMGVFMQFDEDFNGYLTLPQFQLMARYLNYVNTDDDGARLFRDVDSQQNGRVTFQDFCRWRRHNQPHRDALYGMTTFQYTDAILKFRSVDPQIHGLIGWDAFRAICLDNGLADSEQRAWQLFLYCDDRQTGYVSLLQFLKLMQLVNSGTTVPVVEWGSGAAAMPYGFTTSPAAAAMPHAFRTNDSGASGSGTSGGGGGSQVRGAAAGSAGGGGSALVGGRSTAIPNVPPPPHPPPAPPAQRGRSVTAPVLGGVPVIPHGPPPPPPAPPMTAHAHTTSYPSASADGGGGAAVHSPSGNGPPQSTPAPTRGGKNRQMVRLDAGKSEGNAKDGECVVM